MRVFLNVNLRTFCHATEDPLRVKQALEFVLPGCELAETKTTGHYRNPIIIFEAKTDKKSDAVELWKRIGESAPAEKMAADLDTLIDENCILHARLDKQKAYLGKMEMVKHEDVIAVSSKIESYPKRREVAIKNAREFFGNKG